MKKILLAVILLALSGCADSIPQAETVGFWYGLWHGIILPLSWFISLFDSDVAIYAVNNNGGWYDFGFVIGIGSLGGTSHSSKS